ncbi:hypothetical protein E0K89_015160 [Aquicoccus sp. SCR17]|nr:hypothetical protein [Carideicomes alvinocaridis]
MPPAKALRLALARAADHLWSLAAQAQGIREEILDQEALLDSLEAGALYILLDGPEGHAGAAVLDMQAVAALIEVQTMGRVVPGPPPDRPPTHTDAAIAAPLLDRMLRGFARNLSDGSDGWWAEGFRFGDRIEDRRTLGLMLKGAEYRSFRVTVDFGQGARTGEIVLAFPDRARPAPEEPAPPPPTRTAPLWERIPAELMAVVDRLDMSVAEAMALKPGDILRLDRSALGATRLAAGDRLLPMLCDLGQSEGMRALRLRPPEEAGGDSAGAAGFTAALGDAAGAAGPELPNLSGLPLSPEPGADGWGEGSGTDGSLAAFAAAEGTLPEAGALPDLPDLPLSGPDMAEDLPDLPPLDFDLPDNATEDWTPGDLPELDLPDAAEG